MRLSVRMITVHFFQLPVETLRRARVGRTSRPQGGVVLEIETELEPGPHRCRTGRASQQASGLLQRSTSRVTAPSSCASFPCSATRLMSSGAQRDDFMMVVYI